MRTDYNVRKSWLAGVDPDQTVTLLGSRRSADQMGGSCDPRATNNPSDPSLNDLIRARQQQLRNRDSKRLRGLQVDDKVELGGSLDG